MRSLLISLLLLSVVLRTVAQPATIIPASYSAGGVSVSTYGEWHAFHNPALLGTQQKISAVGLYENRFGVKELSTQSFSFSIPTSLLHIGASVSHFGYSGYSELLAGLSFARTFDKYFTLGVQFGYYSATISNSVGQKGTPLVQIGLLSQLSENFFVGFSTFNPTRQKLKYHEVIKEIPSIFSLGASYRFAEDFVWLVQFDKEMQSDLVWRSGFEYQPLDFLRIRIGALGMPFTPSLGCGFRWRDFRFDVNFQRHPVLGISSIGMLRYDF